MGAACNRGGAPDIDARRPRFDVGFCAATGDPSVLFGALLELGGVFFAAALVFPAFLLASVVDLVCLVGAGGATSYLDRLRGGRGVTSTQSRTSALFFCTGTLDALRLSVFVSIEPLRLVLTVRTGLCSRKFAQAPGEARRQVPPNK